MKGLKWLMGYVALVSAACTGYLDAVPDRSRAVLSTIEQYEQLLNYSQLYVSAPSIGDMGIDCYYLPKEVWQSFAIRLKPAYIWQADIYEGNTSSGATQDWNSPYSNIYYTNVVLEGIELLKTEQGSAMYNNVKSHALFLRAFFHYLLQEIYGQPYKPGSAEQDWGIPLKLTADLEEHVHRASVAQTFDRIKQDLKDAYDLAVSDYQAVNKFWSSKAAICALLSRVYLTTQDYENSSRYASECLSLYDELLDLNTLAPNYQFPYPDNPEMLFILRQTGWSGLLGATNTYVDSNLYRQYAAHDLRKIVYYKTGETGAAYFQSLYSGSSNPFSGLAIDEVYLNRAECRSRLGDGEGALADLNRLLEYRYLEGHFTPFTPANTSNLLATILLERKKQMVFRGTRWTDLRRLNQDPRFATTLMRKWGDDEYSIAPESGRYTYPIPDNEITMNNLPQNKRQ